MRLALTLPKARYSNKKRFIIPTIAVDSSRDTGLRVIEASHIFEPAIASVILQGDMLLRGYLQDFIDMLAPRQGSKRRIRELP